jgi:hypothetical protein
MRRTWLALAAFAASALGGCGTVCNFAGGDPVPYGGVANDLAFVAKYGGPGPSAHTAPELKLLALGAALGATELCASAAADTLTLPITVPLARSRDKPEDDPPTDVRGLPVQYAAGSTGDEPPPPGRGDEANPPPGWASGCGLVSWGPPSPPSRPPEEDPEPLDAPGGAARQAWEARPFPEVNDGEFPLWPDALFSPPPTPGETSWLDAVNSPAFFEPARSPR